VPDVGLLYGTWRLFWAGLVGLWVGAWYERCEEFVGLWEARCWAGGCITNLHPTSWALGCAGLGAATDAYERVVFGLIEGNRRRLGAGVAFRRDPFGVRWGMGVKMFGGCDPLGLDRGGRDVLVGNGR
jgi:hypothetical protein